MKREYQFQKIGFGSFPIKYARDLIKIGDRNKVYDHQSHPNTSYNSETIEGQAQMVGNYANFKAGGNVINATQAKQIEARLKGTGLFGL